MFGGKSNGSGNELLTLALQGYKCLLIKFAIDTRYDKILENARGMVTHCGTKFSKENIPNLTIEIIDRDTIHRYMNGERNLIKGLAENDVIDIDEAHFAIEETKLADFAIHVMHELGKVFISAFIPEWANGKPVWHCLELLKFSTPHRYEAICACCFSPHGLRSVLIDDFNNGFSDLPIDPEVKCGAGDMYTTVCLECYYDAKKKFARMSIGSSDTNSDVDESNLSE
jgi:thymidine kinase